MCQSSTSSSNDAGQPCCMHASLLLLHPALTAAAVTRVLTSHTTHHRSCRCPGRRRCRPSSRSLGQSSSLQVRAATRERVSCMRWHRRLCAAAKGAVWWQGAGMLQGNGHAVLCCCPAGIRVDAEQFSRSRLGYYTGEDVCWQVSTRGAVYRQGCTAVCFNDARPPCNAKLPGSLSYDHMLFVATARRPVPGVG